MLTGPWHWDKIGGRAGEIHSVLVRDPGGAAAALRTQEYFRERASRANIAKAKRILKRAGRGNAPVAGDER